MTSVNTALSNYYSLAGGQSGASGGGITSASLTQSLAQALDAADTTSQDSSNSNAYLLSLSPTAQQLLSAGSTGTTTGTPASGDNFVLIKAQQTEITNILEKYKNAPYDQATFNQIQSNLNAAGLGANQLALEDQATTFNPTSVFLAALNGNYTDPASQSGTSSSSEQTKSTNYMQSIISQWKSLSTTAASSTPST